eukprot:3040521-Pleurochrysis_carterae.AAC.1
MAPESASGMDADSKLTLRTRARLGVNQETMLQAVWWVKVLRDDPLRVVRALRFCAKLNFSLHEAFWRALPFALYSLQTK